MYKNKKFLFTLLIVVLSQLSFSQNNTNSPYTRFGFGDISDNSSGALKSMAGVSIGSRSISNINSVNPASYSAVDSMTFMFDVGANALYSRFSQTAGSSSKWNSNLEYITMQFPLTKWLGFSAGLQPYSYSGYNFQLNGQHLERRFEADSIINYYQNFSGGGGFNQTYLGASAKFLNHISVGVNSYYMFGSVYNNRSNRFENSADSVTESNSIKSKNFRMRYGVQFYNTFANSHEAVLGFIYEPKTKLTGDFSSVFNGDTTTVTGFETAEMLGVGAYYTFDKKLSVGMDYTLQNWGDALYFGNKNTLTNRSKLALGAEYQPNMRGRNYFQRIKYRAGVNFSNSYIKVNGVNPADNMSLTLGFGLPLRNTNTILNTTFEYGKVGSTSILREDFFKFTFNVLFNEHWFFKRKL